MTTNPTDPKGTMSTHPTPPSSPLATPPAGPAEAAAQQPTPAEGYPTDTTFAEPNPKRGKVTLTRARDLAAIVQAVKLRLDSADQRFAEVGIAVDGEETNRVRQQLTIVAGKLAEVRGPLEEADQLLEAIVDLLDL